jgi:hypothetical protein
MAGVKLVVIFPNPSDPQALDQALTSQIFRTLAGAARGQTTGRLTGCWARRMGTRHSSGLWRFTFPPSKRWKPGWPRMRRKPWPLTP